MRKAVAVLALLAPLGMTSAMADDDCSVPMADWQPREAVERMAEAEGWTVRRIKIDDGCYEIDGRDAEGRTIEVTVDPATLAILEVEREDKDDRPGARSRASAPDQALPDAGDTGDAAPEGSIEGHEQQ